MSVSVRAFDVLRFHSALSTRHHSEMWDRNHASGYREAVDVEVLESHDR
jgi:hypothetical protein